MSDLTTRLFEEAQDNPHSLYWQAADRIRELENQIAGILTLCREYERSIRELQSQR